jgi:tRNA-Thr(GGU) m(6)t(6)A37 methyltransferase TsaA
MGQPEGARKHMTGADKQARVRSGRARLPEIVVRPIGRVVSREGSQRQEIEIAHEFVPGLKGVEGHEHLWVLFWMHQLTEEDRAILQAHPRGDTTQPKAGVFALHSPCRPNPIGMTRVRLVNRRGNRLMVDGLDAFNGSPVLDIKSG